MLESSDIQALIAATSGIAAGVGAIAHYLRQRSELNGEKLLDARLAVYKALHAMRDETGAERVSLIKLSNSGKIPVVGEPWHGSVYAEAKSSRFSVRSAIPVEDAFFLEQIDEHATGVVQEVCRRRPVFMETESMPRGTALRGLYDVFGVYGVVKIFALSEQGAIFFAVASFLEEGPYEDAVRQGLSSIFHQNLRAIQVLLRKHRWLRERQRLRG